MKPIVEKFVLHWGEMGSRWGVNRSVAQIHGLLYLMQKPMTAEQICDELTIARSNVSNSLKELQALGLVHKAHVIGDRRDHFAALKDVQETFNAIVEARKKREIDPTLTLLRDLADEAAREQGTDLHVKQQIGNMLHFVDQMSDWYEEVKKVPNETLMKMVNMGAKIIRFVGR
ncbi:MAG: ArsR family transcriptional regulator [Hyphomicrobiaceae bacterium]|nr:ArsR family transcriptional regulator [Hyphomicrobiaceae bacterium]